VRSRIIPGARREVNTGRSSGRKVGRMNSRLKAIDVDGQQVDLTFDRGVQEVQGREELVVPTTSPHPRRIGRWGWWAGE
jgi:hypothetical protein